MRTLLLNEPSFLTEEAWIALIILFSLARPTRAGTTWPVTAAAVETASTVHPGRMPSARPSG